MTSDLIKRLREWIAYFDTETGLPPGAGEPDAALSVLLLEAASQLERVGREGWADEEAVARIIDPEAWIDADKSAGRPKLERGKFFPPANEWIKTQPSLTKARAIIALAPPVGDGWEPIETAPRPQVEDHDGPVLWLAWDRATAIGRWTDDGEEWGWEMWSQSVPPGSRYHGPPTHWQPYTRPSALPPPPAQEV